MKRSAEAKPWDKPPGISSYSAQTFYPFHAMPEMGNNSVATGIALGLLTVCRGDCLL